MSVLDAVVRRAFVPTDAFILGEANTLGSSLRKRFADFLQKEELEFNGRWCDDGGRAEED
jgi:hypothetical protein